MNYLPGAIVEVDIEGQKQTATVCNVYLGGVYDVRLNNGIKLKALEGTLSTPPGARIFKLTLRRVQKPIPEKPGQLISLNIEN